MVLLRGAGFPFARLEQVLHASDVSSALREVAADPLFREAVTWQNRAAVDDGLDSLLRKPPGATDSKTRKKELLVLRYLQRYCAKNDTIGFFGPVGWARWAEQGHFAPGPGLIAARQTFLEPWAARALAEAAAADPAQRPRALARLMGDLRLQPGAVLTAAGAKVPLTAADEKLLRRLPARVETLKDAATLESLVARGVVRVGFPVAISHQPLAAQPELAVSLEGVRAAAGTPSLGAALAQLETEFTARTQTAARRHAGQTYGGRGLVYEECRRDVQLELSPQMLAQVARPLSLVLQVARWFTFQVGRSLSKHLKVRKPEPLHVFWQRLAPHFAGATPTVLAPALEKLRALNAELPQDLEAAEAMVRRRCRAPAPGWPSARHHAPDLLWAAPDAEAMLRGEGTPILGELHPGVTPVSTLSVLAHAPDRALLERLWREDFPQALVSPIPWEDFARSSHDARLAKRHWHLDLGFDFDSARPASQVLRAADLEVVGGQVVHRARKLRWPLVQVMERRLKMICAAHFSLDSGAATAPRRQLGEVVIARARWRFTRPELGWLEPGDGRLERARSFRERHRLPRRVFVRSPQEVKPLYLDLEAPLCLELLSRLSRATEHLTLSEMLPDPDQLWLTDAAGARYVCELRCIAVDPVPFG
ncbi:MAG: lantibiotic dehydratase [Archangiaceae bacterium]|nr:lantibiotic dehydratase [Archangiaceae bacterium]